MQNMQAMLKQAQAMQKDMLKSKSEIENTEFTGQSSMVTVTMMGDKSLSSIKIDADSLDKDDIEMLEDMLVVAINDAKGKYDKEMESKMGKYTQGIPGIF